MSVYLYALVPPDATLPYAVGIGGSVVGLVTVGSVAAVVGEVDLVEPTEENLLAHARVVDEVAGVNDAVLPVRFGRGFHDLDALEAALARRAPQLGERLRAVQGCVELGVHAVGDVTEPVAARRGREYMEARLRETAQVAEIHATLAEHARESARDGAAGAGQLLHAAYLVPRRAVDDFLAAVSQMRERHPGLTFACTGPWPPYSFGVTESSP